MAKVLNVSGHPIDLNDGRTLAPGEEADGVDIDHPHNQSLLDSGHVVHVKEQKTKSRRQADDHGEDEN